MNVPIVYFRRGPETAGSGYGSGLSADEPIFVLPGAVGDAQIEAFLDFFEIQGFRPISSEVGAPLLPIVVYTWERDPAVTFQSMSETIRVDPRSRPSNPETIAAAVHTAALARVAAGQKVGLRPWFEYYIGPHPRPFNNLNGDVDSIENFWNHTPVYSQQPISTELRAWWDGFHQYLIDNDTPVDFLTQDNERKALYWNVPNEKRAEYFGPLEVDDENNPYPNPPSPYIGADLSNLNDPMTDFLLSDYHEWVEEEVERVGRELMLGVFQQRLGNSYLEDYRERYPNEEIPDGFVLYPACNYGNLEYGFPISQDSSNRPNRLPYGAARLCGISSPVIYTDFSPFSLLQAEAKYTTTNEIRNRKRWHMIVRRMSACRSACAAVPGLVAPWIGPPGYGRNGSNTWGNSTSLLFEKYFTRTIWRHLELMGIDVYTLWNPVANNPNSADTDAWCDAYFLNRFVGPLVRDLPEMPTPTEAIVTKDFTTQYKDVFEITDFYVRKAPIAYPHTRGFGTRTDPYILSPGSTGDAELVALATSFNNNQDNPVNFIEIVPSGILRPGVAGPAAASAGVSELQSSQASLASFA